MFLELTIAKDEWICPVCNKPIGSAELITDGLILNILKELDGKCLQVEFFVDGAYRAVSAKPTENQVSQRNKQADIVLIDLSDDENEGASQIEPTRPRPAERAEVRPASVVRRPPPRIEDDDDDDDEETEEEEDDDDENDEDEDEDEYDSDEGELSEREMQSSDQEEEDSERSSASEPSDPTLDPYTDFTHTLNATNDLLMSSFPAALVADVRGSKRRRAASPPQLRKSSRIGGGDRRHEPSLARKSSRRY